MALIKGSKPPMIFERGQYLILHRRRPWRLLGRKNEINTKTPGVRSHHVGVIRERRDSQ